MSCSLRRVIINRIREFIIVFIIYIGQDTKCETKAVNQRTNNIMVKRKRTKEQIMIYSILHRKVKNNTNPDTTGGELGCSGSVGSSCSINGNATNINNANTSGNGKIKRTKNYTDPLPLQTTNILFQI